MNSDTKQLLLRMARFLESLLLRKHNNEREAVRIYDAIVTLLDDEETNIISKHRNLGPSPPEAMD